MFFKIQFFFKKDYNFIFKHYTLKNMIVDVTMRYLYNFYYVNIHDVINPLYVNAYINQHGENYIIMKYVRY